MKQKIAKVVRRIYSVALNQWVSVKEHPISTIMQEEGVNRRYSSAISQVLKDAGLLFTEGARGCMRYKMNATTTLDADLLAERIIDLEIEQSRAYNASRPKRNKETPKYGSERGKTSTLKKEPLTLGTKVYFIYENNITEGIVYASQLSDKPGKLYEYTIKFTKNNLIRQADNLTLFLKPEEVTAYLIKNMIKYDAELVAQEISKKHEITQKL